VGAPYGFELVENCVICKLRTDSFFCSLPKASLEAFDHIKYTASYPAGAVLFVEGQAPVALKNSGAYAQAKIEKKKKKAASDDMGPPMD